jgi:hypothetical protein
MARPDVMAVVYNPNFRCDHQDSMEKHTPTPGSSLIRAWVSDWIMLSGFVRYELQTDQLNFRLTEKVLHTSLV